MKRLASLLLLTAALSAQDIYSVPVFVEAKGPTKLLLDQFTLQIDKQPHAILSVKPMPKMPLRYCLLLDVSGRLRWEKGLAEQFTLAKYLLMTSMASGSDVGCLVQFNKEAYLDVTAETDPAKLIEKFQKTHAGPTAIYDAVNAAVKYLHLENRPGYRKIIVLFTDGEDNSSQTNWKVATEFALKAGIPVFIFAPSVSAGTDALKMRELAENTGGRIYLLRYDGKPEQAFAEFRDDLKNTFLISFSAPDSNSDRLLPISVRLASPELKLFAPASASPEWRLKTAASQASAK